MEMRGFAAEIQKIGCQRLRDASQILGDVACISASSEYPSETGLLGWACRTRTQKCRRKLSLSKVAQISGAQPNFSHRDYSRLSCDVGGTQLGPSAKISAGCLRGRWSSSRIAELARIAAIGDANCEDRLKRSARPCRENPAAA